MQGLRSITGVVFLLGLSSLAQNVRPLPAPAEVTISFSTELDQPQFHLGELIPVTVSYTAVSPGKYIWVSQATKLVGGSALAITCSPSVESTRQAPPAHDKFGEMLMASCGGVGGGFGGACADCDWEQPLAETALTFGPVPLNQYVRFRGPGTYSCTASSAVVTAASAAEPLRAALLVTSKPLELTIVDDPAWARSMATSGADAYDRLCRGDDVPAHPSQCFDIAQRISYLDTVDSLAAEVGFFDGREHGWANGFWEAIQRTSYPAEAMRLLANRIQDRDVQVSTSTLETLASWDLRIESPDAFEGADPADYHAQAVEKLRKYVRLLGSSLSRKNPEVLIDSAKTYRFFAEQGYCEEQPLISKEEQNQVLAAITTRQYSVAEPQR